MALNIWHDADYFDGSDAVWRWLIEINLFGFTLQFGRLRWL